MKRYAIILAAEEYEDATRTAYCHADAKLLWKTLVEHCDYADQDVLLKLLKPSQKTTPKEVLDEIEKLVSAASPGDTVLFFYAGHGDLQDGEPYLILPCTKRDKIKQTAIPARDISAKLRQAQLLNMRIFDACHSGVDVRGSVDSVGFARSLLKQQLEEGWMTLASCKADESSYGDQQSGHGIFTFALCNAITDTRPGPVYPEQIKIETIKRVQERSEAMGLIQTPVMISNVSGNVTMATRMAPTPTSKAQTRKPEKTPDIMTRLTDIRAIKTLGGDDHRKILKTYVDSVYAQLQGSAVEPLGGKAEFLEPRPADEIPNELKGEIIDAMTGRFHPVHDIRWSVTQEDTSSGVFFSLKPSVKKTVTRPIVKQERSWPPSWAGIKVVSDGYQPEAMLLVYIIPAQISACLFSIAAVRRQENLAEKEWQLVETEAQNVAISEEPQDQTVIQEFVKRGVKMLNRGLTSATLRRLECLEAEIANTK